MSFHLVATTVFVVFGQGLAAASEQSVADTNPTSAFERGALGVEFGLGLFEEGWDLNGSREQLLDGTSSIWWAFSSRAALVVDFHATRVFQQALRNAFIIGVTPGIRYRIIRGGAWDLFVEAGVGPSWSDTSVPEGGTRFNYVSHAGVGLSRQLSRQLHGVVGARWQQLWNNGREGPDRDPDIQALGGYAAIAVGF